MKKEKKPKTKFQICLLFYCILLAIFMITFLIYVADSLIKYEKNQTEKYIETLLQNACKNKKCNISGLPTIDSEFDSNITIDEALEELLKNADITYEQTLDSSEEEPIYTIYANKEQILNVHLKSSKKIKRFGLLTFHIWEKGEISSLIDHGFFTYEISIPSNYKVYLNDKQLTEEQMIKDSENEIFLEMNNYVEVPYEVKYEVKDLYKIPTVKIVDENENQVDYEKQGTTITKKMDIKKIENLNSAIEEITNIPNILKVAESWSLFLTNDLHGTTHGFQTINQYLINDSALSKYAYRWATGIDIGFTSRHTLENPIFTNEEVKDFEIYNENAFSCDIYLEKNMIVAGKKHQDIMHDRFYFIRINEEWKLVGMQAVTEGMN